ncbi:MAG: prepilin-type N-terminal cleavage/methylation domain-containing protein [Candidatus Paceibacterota bacterium]
MKSKKIFNWGFTLIELLVVVAIIGLLSSVVLAFLNNARAKGGDAAVKTNLHTVANEAYLFYSDNGNSYGVDFADSCPADFDTSSSNMFSKDKAIYDAITEAVKRGNDSFCYSSSSDWAVAVGLKTNANTSWCTDSQGAATQINVVPSLAINGGVCGERVGGWCGDGKCSITENRRSCPIDCGGIIIRPPSE